MPLTPTPRLGLYKPDGPDPFERSKFNETWDKLDLAPGIHVCTFNTRPGWGAGQAGRLAYETDTRRIVAWVGNGWVEPQAAPKLYSASAAPKVKISQKTHVDRKIMDFTALRPGTLMGIIVVVTGVDKAGEISWNFDPIVDGSLATMAAASGNKYPKAINTNFWFHNVVPFTRAVNAGAHSVTLRTTTYTGVSGQTIQLWTYQLLAWLGQP